MAIDLFTSLVIPFGRMYILLLAAITTNGCIARHNEELADWTSKEDKKHFVDETKKHGVVIMGRRTFATIGRPLPGRRIMVLTKEPSRYESIPGSVEYTSLEPVELLKQLESEGCSSAVVAGGATVYEQFLRSSLVDELALTIEPLMFHAGIPLVNHLGHDLALELIASEKLSEQSVLLRYRIKKD